MGQGYLRFDVYYVRLSCLCVLIEIQHAGAGF